MRGSPAQQRPRAAACWSQGKDHHGAHVYGPSLHDDAIAEWQNTRYIPLDVYWHLATIAKSAACEVWVSRPVGTIPGQPRRARGYR